MLAAIQIRPSLPEELRLRLSRMGLNVNHSRRQESDLHGFNAMQCESRWLRRVKLAGGHFCAADTITCNKWTLPATTFLTATWRFASALIELSGALATCISAALSAHHFRWPSERLVRRHKWHPFLFAHFRCSNKATRFARLAARRSHLFRIGRKQVCDGSGKCAIARRRIPIATTSIVCQYKLLAEPSQQRQRARRNSLLLAAINNL